MKKFLTGLVLTVAILVGAGAPLSPAYAATTDSAKKEVCEGISGQAGGDCKTGGADLTGVIEGVLNVLSVLAGVAAVIMIIIAGFKYITSGGDAQAIGSAKNTLLYAVIGVIVVAFSQFIVKFVLGNIA